MKDPSNFVCVSRKKDCFAFCGGNCSILKRTDFPSGQCPFYKTRDEACTNDILRLQRLRSLNLPPREVPEHG